MAFWTYIMASRRNGTTYVGHTDNLYVRTLQHRDGTFDGHTKKYGCKRLVWAEPHATRHDAFTRERRIKEWRRAWKLRRTTPRDRLASRISMIRPALAKSVRVLSREGHCRGSFPVYCFQMAVKGVPEN